MTRDERVAGVRKRLTCSFRNLIEWNYLCCSMAVWIKMRQYNLREDVVCERCIHFLKTLDFEGKDYYYVVSRLRRIIV